MKKIFDWLKRNPCKECKYYIVTNNTCQSFIGILLALLFILRMINATGWNNGHCSCGGKWVYQQAVGHRYETT